MGTSLSLLALLAACSGLFKSSDGDGPAVDSETGRTADSGADADTDNDTDADTSTPATDADADGDGFTVEGGDCDDSDPNTNPGATDLAGDGLDLNCDGVDGTDADADGYASTESGGDDCDDTDAGRNPGIAEGDCNGVDDDCNGVVDDGSACDLEVVSIDDLNCDSYGHAYLFGAYRSTTRLARDDARSYCQDRGYDLVIVQDECEWTWVSSVVASYFDGTTAGQEWWGGLYCPSGACTSSDGFEWVDGSTGYVEWSGNGFSADWDCAEVSYLQISSVDYQLLARAEPCENADQFVCESL